MKTKQKVTSSFAYWRNKVKQPWYKKYKQTIITAIIFACVMTLVSTGIKLIIDYSIIGIQGESNGTQLMGSNDAFWFVHD